MENLKKKIITGVSVGLLGLIVFFLIEGLFSGTIRSKEQILEARKQELARSRELVSRKAEYQSQWDKISSLLPKGGNADEMMNLWIKDILAFASGESITFTKLEPRSASRVYLAFQGDFRKFIHLVYFLLEKDPSSKIDDFSIKQDEANKIFSYELTLGRGVL